MARQATSFESGVTPRAMALAVVPGLLALYLLWCGIYYLNKFPGSANLPWLLLFSIAPLVFAAGLVAVTLGVARKNSGRKVTIAPEGLIYQDGTNNYTLKWGVTAYSMPRAGVLYRVMAITDGKNVARIDDLFFADFDDIVRAVAEAKGGRR